MYIAHGPDVACGNLRGSNPQVSSLKTTAWQQGMERRVIIRGRTGRAELYLDVCTEYCSKKGNYLISIPARWLTKNVIINKSAKQRIAGLCARWASDRTRTRWLCTITLGWQCSALVYKLTRWVPTRRAGARTASAKQNVLVCMRADC